MPLQVKEKSTVYKENVKFWEYPWPLLKQYVYSIETCSLKG